MRLFAVFVFGAVLLRTEKAKYTLACMSLASICKESMGSAQS